MDLRVLDFLSSSSSISFSKEDIELIPSSCANLAASSCILSLSSRDLSSFFLLSNSLNISTVTLALLSKVNTPSG